MIKKRRCRGGLAPNKYLSMQQIQQLRKFIKNQVKARGGQRAPVNEAIIDVMLNSGLRADELCQLQMQDLPHCHGKLVINVRRGKGDVQRSVQISSELAGRIECFVRRYRKGAKPKSFLFVNEHGRQLSYRSLYSRVRLVGKAAGFMRLTPHMLRHTYSIAWYNKTKDLFALKDQLGHSNVQTTYIYAKTFDEEMRRQVEDFDL